MITTMKKYKKTMPTMNKMMSMHHYYGDDDGDGDGDGVKRLSLIHSVIHMVNDWSITNNVKRATNTIEKNMVDSLPTTYMGTGTLNWLIALLQIMVMV